MASYATVRCPVGGGRAIKEKLETRSCDGAQNAWGHTALMEAVCYSNKEAAARLLEAACDFNLREVKAGESALHVAVRKNYTTITDQLLSAGAARRPVYNYQV